MFNEEEYGYFQEPSECDAIISEATEKLKDQLTGAAKSVIQQAVEAKSELNKARQEYFGLKHKMERLQTQIADMEKKIEDADGNIPKKYIDRFIRKYTGFLAPGDKVWVIRQKNLRPVCPLCAGKKTVEALFEHQDHKETIRCPRCSGYGVVDEYETYIEETRVRGVYLKLCFDESSRVGIWNSECVFLQGEEYATRPSNIFGSEEDAKAEVERRKVEEA